ncbi:MAG: tripartite tricarboxylate transporter substrate binding protein [Betaproteobacteria bacterium]|nr:tripartite tricarboxylate transporter substrate binding protein [Betaproteobacteria bacterium]
MFTGIAAALALSLAAAGAYAQDYPTRAINITVPNPPGGMNQIHAQPLSAVLEKLTGQPAPIVNRSGGTGAVGTAYVANQKPDGYNILVTVPNIYLVIEKDKLYGVKSPFSLDQIALIALLSADPLIMFVHPSMPVKTVKQLIALARSRPNDIIFSSSGPYGITHTPTAMFLDATKTRMRHLPTTGGGPAITAVLGGHAQLSGGGPAAIYPYVQSGKLRAIASYGVKPHPALPDVPTFKSQGVNIEAYLWVGLFTTAGVPEPVFNKMRALIAKAAADPSFKQALEKVRVVPDYRDTAEFKKFFDADYRRTAAVIKTIGKL